MNGGLSSLVSRPCLARLMRRPAGRMASTPSSTTPSAAAAADTSTTRYRRGGSHAGSSSAAAIASTSSSRTTTTTTSGGSRAASVTTRAKKGGFLAEMDEIKEEEEEGHKVEFTLPLSIQMYPSMKLRNENKRIGTFDDELAKLAEAMFKIMYETDGVGLAAPQVGVNYRLMVYNEAGEPGQGKEVVLVNPKITKFSKSKDLFEEGCLSFPKMYADVERPTGVQIEAQNLSGKKFKMTLDGFEARVFQHEYDHLDGVLFHDRMTPEVKSGVQGLLDQLIGAHPEGEPKGV